MTLCLMALNAQRCYVECRK